MPTIQEASQQAKDLVYSLSPSTITFQSVVLTISLGNDDLQQQVQCQVYLSCGNSGTSFHQTFKASSLARLLGKIKTELEDVFQPESLEPFSIAA